MVPSPSPTRAMVAAALSTTLGTLPVFLLGGLAFLVRADLGFSESRLGAAATVFFVGSALSSFGAGRAAERFGARRTTTIAAVVGAAALLAIALGVSSYGGLLVALAVAGSANAVAQIGANLSLARLVPRGRQGVAFAVKQSAIPVATALAGLAVPAVGLTIGWRWAFGLAALAVVPFLAVVPDDRARRVPRPTARRHAAPAATRPLVVIAVAGGLGSGAANALGAFLVEAGVTAGLHPGTAGALLAGVSVVGIAMRLANGYLADHRSGRHLPVVAAELALGAVGLGLLAVAGVTGTGGLGGVALVAGAVLGFGLGWSWPGLLNFAVVRTNADTPAAATSITQTGVFLGGAAGPLAFGATVEATSYAVAWSGAAAALLAAAACLLLGRRLLVADLARRGRLDPAGDLVPVGEVAG